MRAAFIHLNDVMRLKASAATYFGPCAFFQKEAVTKHETRIFEANKAEILHTKKEIFVPSFGGQAVQEASPFSR